MNEQQRSTNYLLSMAAIFILAIGLFVMVFGNHSHQLLSKKESAYVKIVKDVQYDIEYEKVAKTINNSDTQFAAKIK